MASWTPRRREGGVAGVIWNLSRALEARGHAVECLFQEDLLPQPVAWKRFESAIFGWRLAKRILQKPNRYDVVNLHAPGGCFYGLMRRTFWKAGPPYVMTMHGLEQRRMYAMRREARKGRAWYFRWKNRVWHRIHHLPQFGVAIRTADQSIVLNREAWSYLQLAYRREPETVWYVPNGVDERFFATREYPAAIAPRLLYVGSWIDHKGVFYLRDAMISLAKQFPKVRLSVIGCSAASETVVDFFGSSLRSHINVNPFVEAGEMPSIYAAHDIFVYPSLMEGLPLVLLEAMANGLPVVTTETCGMADIVQDRVNGLLVPTADGQAVANAVAVLAKDAEMRRRLGRAAQESMQNYTWDRIAERVERIFRVAAEERGRRFARAEERARPNAEPRD